MNQSTGIGIDLGGTGIKAAAFDLESGEVLGRETRPTRDGKTEGGAPAFAVEVRSSIESLERGLSRPAALIGISAPGLADRDGSCIRFMPGRLSGLENLVWRDFLKRQNVTVLNDAHAALLGEIWQGAARGKSDVVLLTLGTGVGGAIASGGRLLRGHLGRAGHLGHATVDFMGAPDICGTPGSLEDAIGNCTADRRSQGKYKSTHDLVAAYRKDDADAAEIWLRSVRALAAAVTSFINILDPECVLIGGGIARAGAALLQPLQRYLDQMEWRPGGQKVEISLAQLGDEAGTYGSVYHALTNMDGNAPPAGSNAPGDHRTSP